MTKRLATDTWSTLTHPFTSYYNSMTIKSKLQFTFHFLFNIEFENTAQYSGQNLWWDYYSSLEHFRKFKVDTHFGVVSIAHKLLSCFTNDADIHFSTISNRTNFSIDKHMSYINIPIDKHINYINIPIDKHMSYITTTMGEHMSCIPGSIPHHPKTINRFRGTSPIFP